ncbi:hypothetical protein [Herbidospora mongoliensis]|uniref:hypothetical protein n=1 Tax=Herbidospora mongoliensis TaxID=688067 RepID=UPI000836FFEC|nr:hypothetical protein [Herbidospora mongoliensis]
MSLKWGNAVLSALILLPLLTPPAAERPYLKVMADLSLASGAAEAEVTLIEGSQSQARVVVVNTHDFWTNVVVQAPSGTGRLTPADPLDDPGGLYAQIGAIGPGGKAVWTWEVDATRQPVSQSIVITPALRGTQNVAGILNLLTIASSILGGIAQARSASAIQRAAAVAATSVDFMEAVRALYDGDLEAFGRHFYLLLADEQQRAVLMEALALLGVPVSEEVAARLVPVISSLIGIAGLSVMAAEMATALFSGSAQGVVTFNATVEHPVAGVDFRNREYTLPCGGISPEPLKVTMRDGRARHPGDRRYSHGYALAVEAVAVGDLTGDGRPEAAVLFACSGEPSNFSVEDVLVFTEGPRQMARLPALEPLPTGLGLGPRYDSATFAVEDGLLKTGVRYYSETDSHASGPSVPHTLSWRWDGKWFAPRLPFADHCVPGPRSVTPGPVCVEAPAGWQIIPDIGDGVVNVRSCEDGAYCHGFMVYADRAYDQVLAGGDVSSPFRRDGDDGWWTGSGPPVCFGHGDPALIVDTRLSRSATGRVGDRTAVYREWTVRCDDGDTQFVRAWILPDAKVMILDGPGPAVFRSSVDRMIARASFS